MEAEEDGTLLKILLPEGETAPCKSVIAWIGAAGEAVPDVAGAAAPAAAPAAPAATAAPAAAAPAAAPAADGQKTIIVAVSYTHLDVYKRQASVTSPTASTPFSPWLI